MVRELLEDGFKAARERYTGAVRLAFLIVAVLLAFHVTTVTQYLRREQALRTAEQEKEVTSELQALMARISGGARDLEEATNQKVADLTKHFVTGLEEDFQTVDHALYQLNPRFGMPPSMPVLGSLSPPVPPPMAQMQMPQMQMPQNGGASGASEIKTLPEDVATSVKSMVDGETLRLSLDPWIKSQIITPRLNKLREGWKDDAWPRLAENLGTLEAAVLKARELSKKDGLLVVEVAQLAQQIQAVRIAGESLTFDLPSNNDWWRSVQEKEATRYALDAQAAQRLQVDVFGRSAKSCEDAVQSAKEKAEAVLAGCQLKVSALEKGFEDQKKRADELAKPLTYLALDLGAVVESFPLILGMGLGVAFFWPGWRRRELLRAWDALIALDPEWRSVPAALGFAVSGLGPLNLGLAAALAWIALASSQLARYGVASPYGAGMLCFQGFVVVLAAAVWRLLEERRTAKWLRGIS